MTRNYIPPDDPGKLLWLVNFDGWLQANGAAHGLSPAVIAEMTARTTEFRDAMAAHETAQAAAMAATQAKNKARAAAIALGRKRAQQLQRADGMTGADRAAAGLTVPDTKPTPIAEDEVLTIPPPLILLDFSMRRQVTVHWGPNPANEHENARPAGTRGCQVQAARGGIPTAETDWIDLGQVTRSPHIHIVKDDTPATYAYRARYVGHNLRLGPFGDPAVCTVSV